MRRNRRVALTMALSAALFYLRLPATSNNELIGSGTALQRNWTAPAHRPGDDRPPACDDECLWTAGINGTWVQDWDFARGHGQYRAWPYPNGHFIATSDSRFRPTPEAPFLWRTSWRWKNHSPCPVDVMTKEGLCDVLGRLGASRVMFYGDSIMRGMYLAFMNRVGDVHAEMNGGHFACDVRGGGDPAPPRVIRVHVGRDWGGNPARGRPRGVYEIDLPTRRFIADAVDERIVAVFNIGTHYHNFTHYREDMAKMLGILSDLYRHRDIYVFRSTSPGHDNCQVSTGQQRVDPLESYGEYRVASPHRFSWDMFEGYNAYARELLYDHNVRGHGPPVHFLDIWNMTVLRRDSHHAPSDCLHYVDPGPVDWWNHLLFTYLRRLSDSVAGDHRMEDDAHAGNCRRVRPR